MGGRARLLWEPTDKLTVNLIGDYADTRTTNGGNFFTFVKSESARFGAGGLRHHGGKGNRNYCTSEQYTDRIRTGGASLQLDYQFAPFTLTSITAYRGTHEQGYGAATNVFRADPLLVRCIIPSTARPTCSPRNCASPRRPTRRWNIPGRVLLAPDPAP
jgi:iron complex outermembrane receptor protein